MLREKLFTAVARFAQLKPETGNKKSPVYCDTQRDWFSKYSHEIFRNIHLEYIQSDNNKNGRNNINGLSLRSGFVQKGRGSLFVCDVTQTGIAPVGTYDWNDGLFDVTWAENNENLVVAGAGDGAVLLFDVKNTKVNSVDWSQTRDEHLVLSGSWDSLIKLWDINQPQSLNTYRGHEHIVYCVVWSPRIPGCFASASGDHSVRVWDKRTAYPQVAIAAHNAEVLTCDWSKYDQNVLFTGSVDCSIRGWDIRNPGQPTCELKGHRFAVRRVKTSPFHSTVLASCSYDFTVRTWNINQPHPMETIEHHTEFVYGLDFNLHVPGQMVDCAWDQKIHVYSPKSL